MAEIGLAGAGRPTEGKAVRRNAQTAMRILLQAKKTGLYFKDIDAWVRDHSEAMDFVSSGAAIDFCVTNRINDVQLVLKFDEQAYDIVMAVTPSPDVPGARPEAAL